MATPGPHRLPGRDHLHLGGHRDGRTARDLVIERDAMAVTRGDRDGRFHVMSHHHAMAGGTSRGMFRELLFGMLYPVGAGPGAPR